MTLDIKSRVGILLASYNGEKYIEKQILSLINQSYSNIMIYINDDNSTDNTVAIINELLIKYPSKIKFSKNDKNIGVVKNFEKLIMNSKEEYIALCDQDDIWRLDKIEKQMLKITSYEKINHKAYLVHSDLRMIDKNCNLIQKSFFSYRKIYLSDEKSLNKVISHNGVMGCTILMNRKLVEMIVPFPIKLDIHDYWISIVNEIFAKRITLQEQLVDYRIHSSNKSNSIQKIKRKRSFIKRFINQDSLPFIGLDREIVLTNLLSNNKLVLEDRKIILAFICYLKLCANPFKIFFELLKYDLIRKDYFYRIKIFIKLIQKIT